MSILSPLSHKPHLSFCQWLWKSALDPSDLVVDATLGNGHDTLWILENVLSQGLGEVHGMDIQEASLTSAKANLSSLPPHLLSQFHPHLASHSNFDFLGEKMPKLFIYNFGYLPGGDKNITTQKDSSLKSIQKALEKLKVGGLITLTIYTGHPEGMIESKGIEEFMETLSPKMFQILKFNSENQKNAPYVIAIHKRAVSC